MPNGLPRTWSFYGLFIIKQKWTWTVGAYLKISKCTLSIIEQWHIAIINETSDSPFLSPNFPGDLLPVKN